MLFVLSVLFALVYQFTVCILSDKVTNKLFSAFQLHILLYFFV
jgi:hypothetical protein